MSQVLSQQEIDSLLNALNTGEIDPEKLKEEEEIKVRAYDFRRPIKLSKEYTNTLHMIFENFSKVASNFLTTQLRHGVNITVGAVEQMSYDEFIRSIPKFTLLTLFSATNLSGTQMLEINPQFCIQAIDLLCGGGAAINMENWEKKDRFTDIELGMLDEVVKNILKSFERAWSEIIETKTKILSLETNPQLGQSMSPNEPVILASFTVEIFKLKSFINICIPYISFENILDKLSFRNWFDFEKEVNDKSRDIISNSLMSAPVDLEVVLGSSNITVEDFLELELGDIIQLDVKSKDPLKLFIEDKLHFLVKPGKIEEKLGVEILQFIEEGEIDE
ncbi:flagellar motor switch protein FliM [Tissierella creatinophila]|uniref:Flagellar motor switch protein FliM n=1 Tax=Tissierella creatinophila DSM 6911 TaxID=1123403 RepID=A0A1U7M2M7_TISCR|nr:flagellar motor switch protein FliM [Tissierella creatinophila]OLS01535.1 flagellar motor switch protein FliM [Tissierella creatinophila DSM 6911]